MEAWIPLLSSNALVCGAAPPFRSKQFLEVEARVEIEVGIHVCVAVTCICPVLESVPETCIYLYIYVYVLLVNIQTQ